MKNILIGIILGGIIGATIYAICVSQKAKPIIQTKNYERQYDSLKQELQWSIAVRDGLVHHLDSLYIVTEDLRRSDSVKSIEIKSITGKYKYLENNSPELERKMKDLYVRKVE